MSRYDAVDDYVYPGTSVLRNKADIRDQAALDAFEADATAVRMLELWEQPIAGRFDFAHLCTWTQAEIAQQAFERLAIGNVATQKAQQRNREQGIANDYSIAGRMVSDADAQGLTVNVKNNSCLRLLYKG